VATHEKTENTVSLVTGHWSLKSGLVGWVEATKPNKPKCFCWVSLSGDPTY